MLERLLALEEIRTLKARYWRYVDTKQWQAFAELFTFDATFTDHSADFACSGREGIVADISGSLAAVTSFHSGLQSELEITSPDSARGIWAMQDYLIYPPGARHATSPLPVASVRGYGHYVEEYLRVGGRWLFQKIELYRIRLETTVTSQTGYPPEFDPKLG
jgi:hypothetical protein